jgi:hypothetical protein
MVKMTQVELLKSGIEKCCLATAAFQGFYRPRLVPAFAIRFEALRRLLAPVAESVVLWGSFLVRHLIGDKGKL